MSGSEPSPLNRSKSFKVSDNSPVRKSTDSNATNGDDSPALSLTTSLSSQKSRSKSINFGDEMSPPVPRKSTTFGDDSPALLSSKKSFRIGDNSPGLTSQKSFRMSGDHETGGLTRSKSFLQQKTANIQVAVRCRPLNSDEKKAGQPSVVTCDTENNSIKVSYGPSSTGKKPKHLVYDHVFNSHSRQDEIFSTIVQPIADEAISGFNCTVFAYGPTGTGKTYTMEGDIDSEENCGLIPRAGKYILEQLTKNHPDFSLKVSFLEIYNEELQDLLSLTSHNRLKLLEDLKRGVICQHLEEFPIFTAKDIHELLRRGIANRQSSSTASNLNSSRSHGIFTFRISIKECDSYGEEFVKTGQLNLVDLAGSECIGRSGAKNERAREAGSINQSLLTLGRVITALVDHHGHIPYRDSKLTRLLQESLGGKAKTCILATLSPSQIALEETISTLDYAYRAKNIKNQPVVNLQVQQKVVMKEYSQEIETLKSLLNLARDKNGVYLDPVEFTNMEARLATQDSQLQELEQTLRFRDEEIRNLKEDKQDLIVQNNVLKGDLETADQMLEELQTNFQETKRELHETFIDLRSTEAVVEAQVQTEATLTAQGMELIKDLSCRQNDVDALLTKVDRLNAKESERMNITSSFVSSVTLNNSELLSSVSALAQQSNDHSKKLYANIQHIVLSGNEICTELKTAISDALLQLKDEAKNSRDAITNSCGELNAQLGETSGLIESTLVKVQDRLSAWLGESNGNLQSTLEHTAALQSQIDDATKNVTSHCNLMHEASEAFVQSQNAHHSDAVKHATVLKEEVRKRFKEFRERSEQDKKETEALLAQKAADIGKAMSSMLRDFASTATSAMDKANEHTTELTVETEGQVGSGVDSMLTMAGNMQSTSVSHGEMIQSLVDITKSSHNAHTTAANRSIRDASDILVNIVKNSDKKQTEFDESLSVLTHDIDTIIAATHATVEKTKESGDGVLTSAVSAATVMTEATARSTEAFNTSLSAESESLMTELKKHFNVVDTHVVTQNEGLSAAKTKVVSLGEKVAETVLKPSGETPTKTFYRKRPPLCATRDHVAIKKELREVLLAKLHEHLKANGGSNGSSGETHSVPSGTNGTDHGLSIDAHMRVLSPETVINTTTTAVAVDSPKSIQAALAAAAAQRGVSPNTVGKGTNETPLKKKASFSRLSPQASQASPFTF